MTALENGRPLTRKEEKKKELEKKIKEKTDAMLKTANEYRNDSLSITQSSSAKAVALARQETRPKTMGGNGLVRGRQPRLGGTGSRAGRTGDLHGFVARKSASSAELAPLTHDRKSASAHFL